MEHYFMFQGKGRLTLPTSNIHFMNILLKNVSETTERIKYIHYNQNTRLTFFKFSNITLLIGINSTHA